MKLHEAVLKNKIEIVKEKLLNHDIFSESNFSLAFKASVKYRTKVSDRVDKSIFLMLYNYNEENNIMKSQNDYHILLKDSMAQKDIFYIDYLLDRFNLLDIYPYDDSNILKSRNNYLDLFVMGGRKHNTEHIKKLFEHQDSYKIIGTVNSVDYNSFLLKCLKEMSSKGNAPSYIYLHSKIEEVPNLLYQDHLEKAGRNNFIGIVDLITKQNILSNDILEEYFIDFFRFQHYQSAKKILINRPEAVINSQTFKNLLCNPDFYGFIDKNFYDIALLIQKNNIFSIKNMIEILSNTTQDNEKYQCECLKKFHLKYSIKSF